MVSHGERHDGKCNGIIDASFDVGYVKPMQASERVVCEIAIEE